MQEKLFDKLTEWIYPSIPKELIYEKVEELFKVLKDCNTEMLKKMYRNCNMLFPVKFEHIDLLLLRQKLENLYEEGNAREDIAQIELRLKSHFLDEDLHVVVALATDIYKTTPEQETIDEFFKFKKHIFTEPLAYLSAQKLLDNLAKYKEMKRQERIDTIAQLKDNIEALYAEESKCAPPSDSRCRDQGGEARGVHAAARCAAQAHACHRSVLQNARELHAQVQRAEALQRGQDRSLVQRVDENGHDRSQRAVLLLNSAN